MYWTIGLSLRALVSQTSAATFDYGLTETQVGTEFPENVLSPLSSVGSQPMGSCVLHSELLQNWSL